MFVSGGDEIYTADGEIWTHVVLFSTGSAFLVPLPAHSDGFHVQHAHIVVHGSVSI